MAYLALYRRFRPDSFDKVIGQEQIVRTLKNQIAEDRIGHAYLFTGTRGTGKTTTAKIFAKAINCLHPKDGSPCGECEACKALSGASSFDVMEIDAASNNGVNEIRELKESVAYPPVGCKYKVYIIDEVHMLTPAAFNALLKTLEEPPKHAVFILATTEPHKMPATILSRCMRFDFKLVPTEVIKNLIAKIYREVGKDFTDEAISYIAKAGEGSVRDALSVADICLSATEGRLEYKDVQEVLGAAGRERISDLVSAIISSDKTKMLTLLDGILSSGKSVGVTLKDLIEEYRNLLIVKVSNDGNKILNLPNDLFEALKTVSESASEQSLLRALDIFIKADADLKYAINQRIVLEAACFKACRPDADYSIDALLSRVNALEKRLENASYTEVKTAQNNEVKNEVKAEPASSEPSVSEVKEQPNAKYTARELMGNLSRALRNSGDIMLWTVVQGMSGILNGNTLYITAQNNSDKIILDTPQNVQKLKNALKALGDYNVKVVLNNEVKVSDKIDEDIEIVKNTFGDDNVTVK